MARAANKWKKFEDGEVFSASPPVTVGTWAS